MSLQLSLHQSQTNFKHKNRNWEGNFSICFSRILNVQTEDPPFFVLISRFKCLSSLGVGLLACGFPLIKPLYRPQVFKVITYTLAVYEIEGVVYIFNGGIQSLYNNTSLKPCFDAITDNSYRDISFFITMHSLRASSSINLVGVAR